MFSKALTNMVQIQDFDTLKILATTAERLSKGEILQIEKVIKKDIESLLRRRHNLREGKENDFSKK